MIRKMTELVKGGSANVDGSSIRMAFVPKNIVRATIAYFVLSFAVIELAVDQHRHATAPTKPEGLMTALGNVNHPVSTRNTKAQQFFLNYAEQLQAIDTTGVPATAHVHLPEGVERPDEPRPSLAPGDAIANAPDSAPDAGLFRVPRVIG